MTATPQIDRFSIPPAKRAARQCIPLPPSSAELVSPPTAELPLVSSERSPSKTEDVVALTIFWVVACQSGILIVANLLRVIWPW